MKRSKHVAWAPAIALAFGLALFGTAGCEKPSESSSSAADPGPEGAQAPADPTSNPAPAESGDASVEEPEAEAEHDHDAGLERAAARVRHRSRTLPSGHPALASARIDWSRELLRVGRYEQARGSAELAVRALEQRGDPRLVELQRARVALGEALRRMGQAGAGDVLAGAALSALDGREELEELAWARLLRARCALGAGRPQDAMALADRGSAALDALYPPTARPAHVGRLVQAEAQWRSGSLTSAQALLDRALPALEMHHEADPLRAEGLLLRARVLAGSGARERALEDIATAAELLAQSFPEGHPLRVEVLDAGIDLARREGREELEDAWGTAVAEERERLAPPQPTQGRRRQGSSEHHGSGR